MNFYLILYFSFQPLLVTIVSGDDGNDCETHYPLCPYGKKCTYGSKCKYFHIERRYQNPFSISESLQRKARLEKSRIQHGIKFFLISQILFFILSKIRSKSFTYVCIKSCR